MHNAKARVVVALVVAVGFARRAPADVAVPADGTIDPGIASCAVELERARAGEARHPLPDWFPTVEVVVESHRVTLEARYGDMCMGKDEYLAVVERDPGPPTGWRWLERGRPTLDEDPNQRRTRLRRRAGGLTARLETLAGNWGDLSANFLAVYRRALDRCLAPTRAE